MVELKVVHKLLLFIAVILSMITLSKLFNGDKKEKVEKKVEPKIENPYEKIAQSMSAPIPASSSDGTIPEDIWKHLFERSGSSPFKMPRNILNRPVTRLESTRYNEPKVEEPKVTSFAPLTPSDISQHAFVGNTSSPSIAFSIPDSSIPNSLTHDRLLID